MYALLSIASRASGSLPKVARTACQSEMPGAVTHTMRSGSTPRTMKTAVSIPQRRNHLRARSLIVLSMCALTMALSTLWTTSSTRSPTMVMMAVSIVTVQDVTFPGYRGGTMARIRRKSEARGLRPRLHVMDELRPARAVQGDGRVFGLDPAQEAALRHRVDLGVRLDLHERAGLVG